MSRQMNVGLHGDHCPDNVKFTDNSLTVRGTQHVKCYSYHARRVGLLVLNTCTDANMQFTMDSFRQLFLDKIFSLTFPRRLVKSLTFP